MLSELQLLAVSCSPDIICITESWISKEISDSELFIPGYHLTRMDRDRNGGGVLMYVSSSLQFFVLPKCDGLELLSVNVSNSTSKVCVSLPPNSPAHFLDMLSAYIESLNIHRYTNYILLGDFNKVTAVVCCFLSFGLCVIYPVHHQGSTSLTDLFFVTNNLLTNFCNEISPLGNSDHNGIHMECSWRSTAQHNCANNSKGRIVWCYDQADWERALTLIDSFDWSTLFSNDVNETWNRWYEKFLSIMRACIPTVLPKRKNLPWLSKGLINSIKRRNLLYKQGKLSGNLSKYRRMRNSHLRIAHSKKIVFPEIES